MQKVRFSLEKKLDLMTTFAREYRYTTYAAGSARQEYGLKPIVNICIHILRLL